MESSRVAPPTYNISQIANECVPNKKWFGHQLRIDKNNVVHIDSTFGRFLRENIFDDKYADATQAKAILQQIVAQQEEPAASDNDVITAAVKTLVLAGQGRDEIQDTHIAAVFDDREEQVYKELKKKPEIKALVHQLDLDVWPWDESDNIGDKLHILKEYGVDLKNHTIDYETCIEKLSLDIVKEYPGLLRASTDRTALKESLKSALVDIKHNRRENLSDCTTQYVRRSDEERTQLNGLKELSDKGLFSVVADRKVESRFYEAFSKAGPAVQARFLLDAVNDSFERGYPRTIDTVFSKMSERAKRDFVTIGLPEAREQEREEGAVENLLEQCPKISEYLKANKTNAQ